MKNILITVVVCLFFTSALLGQDLSKAYEKVVDGVVVIMTQESEVLRQRGQEKKVAVAGLGTGFLVDDLYIMTASHVVHTA